MLRLHGQSPRRGTAECPDLSRPVLGNIEKRGPKKALPERIELPAGGRARAFATLVLCTAGCDDDLEHVRRENQSIKHARPL
jgi:hypothetical protein